MEYLHSSIKKLITVFHYYAPRDGTVQPVLVPEGVEYIELLSGGEVNVNNTLYRRGTMFWHQSGEYTIHSYPPDNPYSCFVFKFAVDTTVTRLSSPISQWNDLAVMDETCKEIMRCFHNDNYDNAIIGPYTYATLFWHAYHSSINQIIQPSQHQGIKRAVKFIEQHVANELNIKDIATAVGVSESHLYLLFREHLSTTPHQYILMHRLQNAKHLLASSTASIKQVGFECGFSSNEHFYRVFKQKYSQTPGEYRRYHQAY